MKRNPVASVWSWTFLRPEAVLMALCCASLAGCGQSSPAPQAQAPAFNAPAASPTAKLLQPANVLGDVVSPLQPIEPSASQTAQAERGDEGDPSAPIQQVSAVRSNKTGPAALMAEIVRLRTAPTDVIRQPRADAPNEFDEVQLTPEQSAKERVRRLYLTLDLAMQVIGKTYRDPEHLQEFGNAVTYLSEARVQLYFAGDEEQAVLLQKDADVLFKQDPTSFATIECNYKVLQLTQTLAERSSQEARWTTAFARQARIFAERCPQETSRAAVALATAARMCDQLGAAEEARQCYAVLTARYPESPFARRSTPAQQSAEK